MVRFRDWPPVKPKPCSTFDQWGLLFFGSLLGLIIEARVPESVLCRCHWIKQVLVGGALGQHFYTMNQSALTLEIFKLRMWQ